MLLGKMAAPSLLVPERKEFKRLLVCSLEALQPSGG